MADHTPRTAVVPAQAHDILSTPSARAALDANGFDPAEFEWRPVPRRPRADGWTPDVQRAFIDALARTGVVEEACREVDMSVGSAYRLRQAPGAEGFARAWHAALTAAAERLLDLCFERAVAGVEEPVFDREGFRIGSRRRFDHRLAALLLRAYLPGRFRHAHRDAIAPGESPPPAEPRVAEAAAALAPVQPAEPHRLMPPEQMAELIDGARGVAEVEQLHPLDEREPYRPRRAEQPHPRSVEKRRSRHLREAAREHRKASRGAGRIGEGDRRNDINSASP